MYMYCIYNMEAMVTKIVKYLPTMWETHVPSLEKGKSTYSSILAWRISWTEEPGRLQSMGSQSQT